MQVWEVQEKVLESCHVKPRGPAPSISDAIHFPGIWTRTSIWVTRVLVWNIRLPPFKVPIIRRAKEEGNETVKKETIRLKLTLTIYGCHSLALPKSFIWKQMNNEAIQNFNSVPFCSFQSPQLLRFLQLSRRLSTTGALLPPY